MYKTLLLSLLLPLHQGLIAHDFHHSDDAPKAPAGMEHIGNSHGEIAVDKAGLIYVSVMAGAKAGIQVYDAKGKYLHNVPKAPKDFHGFVIHEENGVEYIYGTGLVSSITTKMTLKGEVVLNIAKDKIPAKYHKKTKKGTQLKLTSADVAPNGDIYVVDGYGRDFIHRFDKLGKYLSTFGGRAAPFNFSNCHKVFVDRRYIPARLLCTNRAKGTLIHLSLEGEFIAIHSKKLRRPSAVAFRGDNIAIAEINGRVSILNKKGEVIKIVSVNDAKYQGNRTKPKDWKPGIVCSPHGIAYDKQGNILVTEYSLSGRVLRFDITEKKGE